MHDDGSQPRPEEDQRRPGEAEPGSQPAPPAASDRPVGAGKPVTRREPERRPGPAEAGPNDAATVPDPAGAHSADPERADPDPAEAELDPAEQLAAMMAELREFAATAQLRRERAMEPAELIRQSGVVMRVGRVLLSSGTGSYRVKTAMQRVAAAIGLDRLDAHVALTEITATSRRGDIFRTETTEVRTIGVNAARIQAVERLVHDLPAGSSASAVNEALDDIESVGPLYGALPNALFAAVACAAFAFLNDGGPIECLGAFLAAGTGQLWRRRLLHKGLNQIGVTLLAAVVACVVYLLVVLGLEAVGLATESNEAGYTSGVLFLVPGFPLVTGALDLAKLDLSAGVSRIAYAVLITLAAACAVWAFSPQVLDLAAAPLVIDPALRVTLRVLASGLGVLGFALIFNSPPGMALAAAAIGAVANTLRLEAITAGVSVQAATAAAALVVGLLATYASPRLRVPRITLSVPGVVIMIPGVAAYKALAFLNNGDAAQAVTFGVRAVFTVVAIAVGLSVARMLTDRAWAYSR